MSLYSTAVKKPVSTIMIFIGVVILGLYSYFQLPVDFFPKMDPPYISVITFYSGANAADVEQNITRKLEDSFGSLTNLKNMTSTSKDNISVVMLEFEWGANLDEATNEVRDAVGLAERSLPDEVESPTIFKISTSMIPVLMFSITSDESYAGIKDILDDRLIQPLNRIEGVGNIIQMGAPTRAIMVDVDPRKLDAYNLTVEQISGILTANNLNLPSGNLEMGKSDLALRLQGEFENSDVVKNIIISNFNGKTVYLKDVATVHDGLKDVKSYERSNGEKSVRVMIQKQSDANTVTVANKVKESLVDIKKTLPPDIKIETLFDTSINTTESINNLSETLIYALIFVVVVVLFFLGRWRATFIVSLSIPISLIAGFIYMYLSGGTINLITLSSLSIAIGMVVDDSIVVLENITKKLERGGFARESAIYGTNEVSLAVIASTLTIVAVFLPLTMLGGMTGILFKPLGWVVTITIATSVIVSLTLVPMLASKILRTKSPDKKTIGGKIYWFSQDLLEKMDNIYEKSLSWAVGNRWTVIIIATVIFISSLFLINVVGTEFMPASDNDQISAQVKLAQGTKLDETILTAQYLDSVFINKYPEIEIISTSAGSGDENSLAAIFSETGNYIINYTFKMKPRDEREKDIFQIANEMRKDIEVRPEIEKYYVDAGSSRSSGGMGMGGGSVLEVKVFGNDFDETNILSEKIAQALNNIEGTKDVIVSRDREKTELQLILDNEKMTSFGLNTATVATAIRNRINGVTATKYKEDGNEYDVIVRYDEKFRQSTEDIENISITTPQGKIIKLGEITKLKSFYSPPNIERENKVRVVTVSSALSGSDLGTVKASLEEEIAKMDIPNSVSIEFGGSVEDMQESFGSLIMLILLSLVLVYIVMASQFESLTEPFIIMFSIPFALTGVLITLYIFNSTINIISLIGIVMLIGIVVKNGIVLVDYTNLLADKGYSLKQAVIAAGRSRLRPVLMTSLTTILAMIPMIASTGSGSEMWKPMGIAIFGGLTFSTLVTLLLIPTIYTIFGVGKINRARKKALNN
ncbi:MAG: multidrug transporter AcrB [Bacteroidetes bacterium GWC2_33_15]|nr:MAG: multidrug transporter AcrB [Bacteroidetes bacterium GWA2_33_15]OFX48747.1 MAG: multidrug transporter AcrB [Bacteroidetes bacterium GWC2_33_15]OFX65989.1 MAG: multidrug transporter AcrB [Bacteroidetes bacterium GWB2_32_14]OFX68250.1 MAG: multidrug transporter AcrB [Bacteroidetes bacterium GWD2_33_33]HAN18028.1 multidrug transporter AcrB [Bacteroidales bacterium]